MRRSTIPLTVVLVTAMAVSTFQLFALAVLAADIIKEFDISRGQIGWLGAANTGVGAVLAPRLGRLTDQLGPKRSIGLIFLTSGACLVATGLAPSYWVLVAASLLAGIPQGWSNSGTNKLIALRLGAEERGLVTGFKQSGVQLAVFLSGLGMPALADSVTWQVGLIGIGVAVLVAGLVAWQVLGPDTHGEADSDGVLAPTDDGARLPPFVYQVAVYALLMGLASGGVGRFLPLFANERLGFSVAAAGVVIAAQGIIGIVARLVWGRLTEAALPLRPSMLAMALGGTGVFAMLLAAETIGGWILYPLVILMAFTTSAWNVVAMLAVIKSVPSAASGRATGLVMLMFLGGLTVSSPAVGWMVDRSGGSYTSAWWSLLAMTALGALSVARDAPRFRSGIT